MSGKEEIAFLKEKAESLEGQLLEMDSTLKKLRKRRDELKDQVEEFSTRTSELAKRLLAKKQKEVSEYEEQIAIVESQLGDLQSNFEKAMDDIRSLENGLARYVFEQVERMVHETLDYIKAHYEEFGVKIRKGFRIECETKLVSDRFNGYSNYYRVPTGNIVIIACDYEYNGLQPEEKISMTEDYCFEENLYDTYIDVFREICAKYTDWFNRYSSMFTKYFLKKLQAEYNFEDFKLTITDSGFTLELV